MDIIKKYKYIFALLAIFLGSIFLNLFHFKDNFIFAYDQARDAQRIMDIAVGHHLKLVGPETDIQGVFNGPLLYYLLAPIYLISHFNPNAVAFFILILNTCAIFLLYYFAKVLFNNRNIGLLAGILWAVSFAQSNYDRFISNASLMGISTIIFFLGLALYFLKDKRKGLPISIIGLGCAIQFNFYLVYLVMFYVIFLLLYPKRIIIKDAISGVVLFILLMCPFILAELKWHFMMIHSLLSYASNQGVIQGLVADNFTKYVQRIAEASYYSFFSFNIFLSFLQTVFFLVYVFLQQKDKKSVWFLFTWFFSSFPLFAFNSGVLNGQVINGPILGAFTLLYAVGIYHLWRSRKYALFGPALLALIILCNLKLFAQGSFVNIQLFSMQPLLLKNEKQVIDYTYKQAHGRPFSVCAVTNPLFVNTLWSFLYGTYGKNVYGYLPFWSGQQQYANQTLLPYDTNHVPLRFIIYEPNGGIPLIAAQTTTYIEDGLSTLQQTRSFGSISVESRVISLGKHFVDTQGLTNEQVGAIATRMGQEARYSCYNTYTRPQ